MCVRTHTHTHSNSKLQLNQGFNKACPNTNTRPSLWQHDHNQSDFAEFSCFRSLPFILQHIK